MKTKETTHEPVRAGANAAPELLQGGKRRKNKKKALGVSATL
jgi:hypothetical protein